MTAFIEKLRAAARSRHSQLCIGLDPDPELLEEARDALAHCLAVVERTSEFACCYKPNSAFWEQYGPSGLRALAELRRRIPADIPVLLDAKRGDVGNTMAAYARAAFEALEMDACTVNPYLGADSLHEFTRYAERGIYVLCRTSNPGAGDLQHLETGGQPLYLKVAAMAERLNEHGNVGLVVGSTAPAQIGEVRQASRLPFLIPGIGAQGGDLEASVRAAWNGDEASCLISASRSVIYAEDPGAAARELRDQINSVLARV